MLSSALVQIKKVSGKKRHDAPQAQHAEYSSSRRPIYFVELRTYFRRGRQDDERQAPCVVS
jgi:hypothetical protein